MLILRVILLLLCVLADPGRKETGGRKGIYHEHAAAQQIDEKGGYERDRLANEGGFNSEKSSMLKVVFWGGWLDTFCD